jgi:hypothetical protein
MERASFSSWSSASSSRASRMASRSGSAMWRRSIQFGIAGQHLGHGRWRRGGSFRQPVGATLAAMAFSSLGRARNGGPLRWNWPPPWPGWPCGRRTAGAGRAGARWPGSSTRRNKAAACRGRRFCRWLPSSEAWNAARASGVVSSRLFFSRSNSVSTAGVARAIRSRSASAPPLRKMSSGSWPAGRVRKAQRVRGR